jgi:hypothetical protein
MQQQSPDPPGPLGEAGARLRANQQLVASAINWVDEWLPTEGPAHCRNEGNLDEYAFERADVLKVLRAALLSAPVVSPPQEECCQSCGRELSLICFPCAENGPPRKAAAAPVVTQEGESPCP